MVEKQSLKKINKNELLDLLENTGILQEVNRTFFHPIGLNLKLEEDLVLSLETSEDEHGVVLHTVDLFKTKTFGEYRVKKHKKRHEMTGFIIQTRDMIRSDKLEIPVTSPPTLKLNILLTELDNFAYEIKKRLMQVSPEKDNNLENLEPEDLSYKIQMDYQQGNFIDAFARAMMLEKIEPINKRLKEIRKIDQDQKEVYKESK